MSHEGSLVGGSSRSPVPEPGGLRVDPETRRAYAGQREIELTKQLFDVLAYLLANEGRVVPNSELVRAVWEHEVVGDRHFLQTAMYRLRAALRAAQATDPIEVVRGVGYTIGRRPKGSPPPLRGIPALEAMIRAASGALIVLDVEGQVVVASKPAARLLKYGLAELESLTTVLEFVPDDLHELLQRYFNGVLEGQSFEKGDCLVRLGDGSVGTLRTSLQPIKLGSTVVGVLFELFPLSELASGFPRERITDSPARRSAGAPSERPVLSSGD